MTVRFPVITFAKPGPSKTFSIFDLRFTIVKDARDNLSCSSCYPVQNVRTDVLSGFREAGLCERQSQEEAG
jgi:hypothetical protein